MRDFTKVRPGPRKVRLSEQEARIFERDGWRCAYCGCAENTLVLDHKQPKSRGGTCKDDNLLTACWTCNSSKGGKSYEAFREFIWMQMICAEVSYDAGFGA